MKHGAHRSGAERVTALTILLMVVSYLLYAHSPRVATGALLGLAACVAGMTLQHGGNHGGLSTNPIANRFFGAPADCFRARAEHTTNDGSTAQH